MFDAIADRPVSEERPASRIRPTHSALLAKLENTVCEQIASIPALLEDAVVRLFGDAGRVTESTPDTKVISVIQTVVSRSLVNLFRSVAFYLALEGAVHKCVSEPPSFDAVATRMIDASAFVVPVAKFIKKEFKRSSLDKAKIEERFNKMAETVMEEKISEEDGILTKRMDSAQSKSPPTDISGDKKTSPNA